MKYDIIGINQEQSDVLSLPLAVLFSVVKSMTIDLLNCPNITENSTTNSVPSTAIYCDCRNPIIATKKMKMYIVVIIFHFECKQYFK